MDKESKFGNFKNSSDGRRSPTIVEPDDTGVTLLTLRGVDGRQVASANLQADRCLAAQKYAPGGVSLKRRTASLISRAIFSEFRVRRRTWHHLMVVHKKDKV